MLWDEDDTFGRWLQGICAFFLLSFGLVVEYYDWLHLGGRPYRYGMGGIGIGALYLGYRCARYAITGRNNINRDNF